MYIFASVVLSGFIPTSAKFRGLSGTFTDHFIARSALSPRVKKIENRSTFAEIMGN